jgi:putative heme-binding domain-containing protein
MVYLGDNWPEQYRNTVFMNNIHGRRINNDLLRRSGSGYVASHAPDLMRSRDPWYMGVTLQYGPDGAVFASDWSDTGECHSVKNTQRQTGRIFKIAYGAPTPLQDDLAKLEDEQLVELQLHRNDWHVRHARRILQERAAAGRDMTHVREALLAIFADHGDVTRKLRALWALHAIGGLDDEFLVRQLNHASEYLRAWSVQLLCEDHNPPREALERFRAMAAGDDSPLVRLYLASALQRLAPGDQWPIAEALLSRGEDAGDQNLPLMIWYGVEPLVEEDLERFIALSSEAKLPLARRFIARRAVAGGEREKALEHLARILGEAPRELEAELLSGALEGLQGVRSAPMPAAWRAAYSKLQASPERAVREQALELALVLDDPAALRALRTRAADPTAANADRVRAVQALVAKKAADLGGLLFDLLRIPELQSVALRSLAEFDEPGTVETILENYPAFAPEIRQDALQTLASRAAWAATLLDAIESGAVPRTDVTAYTARQIQSLRDEQLAARLLFLWGELRTTPAEKARLIADYKRRVTPESLQRADRAAGRAVFEKSCANCHRLFGAGGEIGPDITGAQRTNLDYLLENLLDPSAAVSKDYQMEVVETAAGRVITGLVVAETEAAVTVQTANEKIVVPRDEIETRALSPLSMMPDGLLQQLTFEQVRNLLAYLSGSAQISQPTTGGE